MRKMADEEKMVLIKCAGKMKPFLVEMIEEFGGEPVLATLWSEAANGLYQGLTDKSKFMDCANSLLLPTLEALIEQQN